MKTLNLKGFVEQKVLGQGSYGCVYKAKRISDDTSYAVKVITFVKLQPHEVEEAVNEIRLMASFNSQFIIRFYEASCSGHRLHIVSEYSRLGDLAHLIERKKKKNRPLREDMIWMYLLEIIQGLNILHSAGVVHRDLKAANILVSAPDLVKIGDLGISTVLHKKEFARTQIGTPLYIAPEVWRKRPYDQKCDMWSLGVLLYEMMTFTHPFTGRNNADLAHRVCDGKFLLPKGKYSSDLVMIVRRLLQVNPVLRPSCRELLHMQCIQQHMPLLDPFLDKSISLDPDCEALLETIRIPLNMRNVNLPLPAYNKKVDIIKPLEQRAHVKRNVPIRKSIESVSSPELQLITDFDWWEPNKESDNDENSNNKQNAQIREPGMIENSKTNQLAFHRRNIRAPSERKPNPRIRRIAIR